MHDLRRRLARSVLMGVVLVAGSVPAGGRVEARNDKDGLVYVFEATTVFRKPNPVPGGGEPVQTGEVIHTGLMSASFVTVPPDTILGFEVDPATGVQTVVLRHTDHFISRKYTHTDGGEVVPDSFDVPYTIVAIISPTQPIRVTYNGPLLNGTGIFQGATGVFNGAAHDVNPDPALLQFAFEGTASGEVHFAPGAFDD
jgi:hypothetical protein